MFEYLLGWCLGDLDILYKTLREFEEMGELYDV